MPSLQFDEFKKVIISKLESCEETFLMIEGIPPHSVATIAEACRQLRQEFLRRDTLPILVCDAARNLDEAAILPTGILLIAFAFACEEISKFNNANPSQLIDEFSKKALKFHEECTSNELEAFLEKHFGFCRATSA